VVSIPEDYDGLVLRWDAEGLSLSAAAKPGVSPTRVDFLSGAVRHRLATSRKSAGLLKAAGLDKFRESPRVLDATAGLGIDAYSLAAMGCHVTLLEKSPVMAALLADGIRRGLSAGDADTRANLQRMTLHTEDAHVFMGQIPNSAQPDVILLDPMFPPRQKSARVKKDMALMQQLLPANDDIETLLASARQLARKRVVLKQPGKDSRHADPKPDFEVPGKACHFQVFLTG
jgi:16S rRNA (guanine1516-N2)-methyltransferase